MGKRGIGVAKMPFEVLEAGGVTAPQGYVAAGIHCGLKRKREDLAIILSDRPASCAGTFTRNLVKGAPVVWSAKVVERGLAQAIVVNSGNANTCNGPQGAADAERMAELVAGVCGVKVDTVVVGSTGVIGMPLDMGKVENGIQLAATALSPEGGTAAAKAIMTTDTHPKEVAVEVRLAGGRVRIGGMAKGSGMIHPNMATMMGFITTDAVLDAGACAEVLRRVVDKSFNMVSVDGDTSTNDMVILLANGASGVHMQGAQDIAAFEAGLEFICVELAKMVARDGEGASKLIEIRVLGARSYEDARQVARSISTSNLVKTAIYGEDANWGRVFCAAGYSGAQFRPDLVDIYLGDVQVAARGMALAFDEQAARSTLQEETVTITINLNEATESATAWTCDFTYDYVKINASYRS